MSNSSISISFSTLTENYEDLAFVNIEQIETDETASVSEVAELVDSLYGITSCTEDGEAEEESTSESASVEDAEEFYQTISESFDLQSCNAFSDGSWSAQIALWKSHPTVEHVLKIVGGEEVSSSVVSCQEFKSLEVSNGSYLTLDKPIVGGHTFTWSGLVLDSNKNSVRPTINVTGNTLWWDGSVTGTINCTYMSQYTQVDILVYSGEDEEQGTCTVWCFFMGVSDNLELSAPTESDLDSELYCSYVGKVVVPEVELPVWETLRTEYFCQCSNDLAYYTTSKSPTNEDASNYILPGTTKVVNGGYVDCNEYDPTISDPEFYKDKCCEYPLVSLPKCRTQYTHNEGGKTLSAEEKASYIERFSPKPVSFIQTAAESGDCGYIKYTQSLHAMNCCDEVSSLGWDSENSAEVIADNASGIVVVTGGKLPLTVSISGSGFYLDGNLSKRSITTYNQIINIYTGEACGTAAVRVTDGCSSVLGKVRSTNGDWVTEYLNNNAGVDGYVATGTPAYAEGCVASGIGTSNLGSSSTSKEFIAENGEYRVTQIYGRRQGAVYAARRPYSGAVEEGFPYLNVVDTCAYFAGIYPTGITQERLSGGCFEFEVSCMGCDNECIGPNGSDNVSQYNFSYDLGFHSTATTDCTASSGWCYLWTGWSIVRYTKVEKWVC